MEVKKYTFVTISKNPGENILFFDFNDNLSIDVDIIKEVIANRHDFANGEDHYLIMDLSNLKHISSEAKNYAYSSEAGLKNILAGAFIATNPVSRLLANVLVKTTVDIPSKMFTDKESALKWILEIKKQNNN